MVSWQRDLGRLRKEPIILLDIELRLWKGLAISLKTYCPMPTPGEVPTVVGRNVSLATNQRTRSKIADAETSSMRISA